MNKVDIVNYESSTVDIQNKLSKTVGVCQVKLQQFRSTCNGKSYS